MIESNRPEHDYYLPPNTEPYTRTKFKYYLEKYFNIAYSNHPHFIYIL